MVILLLCYWKELSSRLTLLYPGNVNIMNISMLSGGNLRTSFWRFFDYIIIIFCINQWYWNTFVLKKINQCKVVKSAWEKTSQLHGTLKLSAKATDTNLWRGILELGGFSPDSRDIQVTPWQMCPPPFFDNALTDWLSSVLILHYSTAIKDLLGKLGDVCGKLNSGGASAQLFYFYLPQQQYRNVELLRYM